MSQQQPLQFVVVLNPEQYGNGFAIPSHNDGACGTGIQK
jgi:hypothetical protein